jgi:hypothetical protein
VSLQVPFWSCAAEQHLLVALEPQKRWQDGTAQHFCQAGGHLTNTHLFVVYCTIVHLTSAYLSLFLFLKWCVIACRFHPVRVLLNNIPWSLIDHKYDRSIIYVESIVASFLLA